MTLDELRKIAMAYAGRGWVKTWHDYRAGGESLLAIQVRCYRTDPYTGIATLEPMRLTQLEDAGFRTIDHEKYPWLYAIGRTNEDGTPYGSTTDAH